jgi:IS5 family transposase
LDKLPKIVALRLVWERHYERKGQKVRFRSKKELANAPPGAESPYDPEARYRHRGKTKWVGYIGHVTETCDDDNPHLITHVVTTTANLHEVSSTEAIHQALIDKGLPPSQHLVDSAYVDADLLVKSREEDGIIIVGPTRKNPTWQARTEGAYDHYQFDIDWENERIRCPQGKVSKSWYRFTTGGKPFSKVLFRDEDCNPCQARHLCTKGAKKVFILPPQAQYEALREQRRIHASKEGKKLYNKRAGVEGTISQGVRAFGLRKSRYRGLAKTHLQHVATAAAINFDRLVDWFDGVPRGKTRRSSFAALAPV